MSYENLPNVTYMWQVPNMFVGISDTPRRSMLDAGFKILD